MNIVDDYNSVFVAEAKNIILDILHHVEKQDFVAHCPTREDMKLMTSICEFLNINPGQNLADYWRIYEDDTCVNLLEYDTRLYYDRKDFYLEHYPTIKILEYNSKNLNPNVILAIKDIIK